MAGLDNPLQYKQYYNQFSGPWKQKNTIEMYDNALAQYFGVYGIPIDYYPVEVNYNKDRIFGEDTAKRYIHKRQLTCIVKDGAFEENLVYNGFGEITQVEFQIYIHLPTFRKLVNRDPLSSDNFYLPNSSNIGYEVVHVDWMTLGLEGNIFGQKNTYILTCKSREYSEEQYGLLDQSGNLIPNAPADAYVPDGSLRIQDKYNVPIPKTTQATNSNDKNASDNNEIANITEGIENQTTGVREGGLTFKKNKIYWGDW